jgi:hypothetical protein
LVDLLLALSVQDRSSVVLLLFELGLGVLGYYASALTNFYWLSGVAIADEACRWGNQSRRLHISPSHSSATNVYRADGGARGKGDRLGSLGGTQGGQSTSEHSSLNMLSLGGREAQTPL